MQRYFVQGMIDAAQEFGSDHGHFDVRFDYTIPAGAETCHFSMWKATEAERAQWAADTKLLEAKALLRAQRK